MFVSGETGGDEGAEVRVCGGPPEAKAKAVDELAVDPD